MNIRMLRPILMAMIVTIVWGASPRAGHAAQIDPAEKAVALEQRASDLQTRSSKGAWYKAAVLYRDAAKLRGEADAQAVESLIMAGRLFFQADEMAAARGAMTAAGDRALAQGDIMAAAGAYADVAWLAKREGRGSDAREFAGKVEMLAASPLLTASQREALLRRVERVSLAQAS